MQKLFSTVSALRKLEVEDSPPRSSYRVSLLLRIPLLVALTEFHCFYEKGTWEEGYFKVISQN